MEGILAGAAALKKGPRETLRRIGDELVPPHRDRIVRVRT